MRTNNIFGMAYHFCPRDLNVRGTATEVSRGTTLVTEGNRIYLMIGEMPTTEELYQIGTADEFEVAYGDNIAYQLSGLQFTYTYDKRNKERVIRKTPVDAIHFDMEVTGTIGWFMVVLTDVDGTNGTAEAPEDTLFFSDSIGIWTDTERAVMLESLPGISGEENIFKDFVLSIQDGLKSELVTE